MGNEPDHILWRSDMTVGRYEFTPTVVPCQDPQAAPGAVQCRRSCPLIKGSVMPAH
jgi:hypothetical protein